MNEPGQELVPIGDVRRNTQDEAISALEELFRANGGEETIDGVSVRATAEYVDLSIAFTPVVIDRFDPSDPNPCPERYLPRPVPVWETHTEGTYLLNRPLWLGHNGYVSASQVREMRARYLLIRGALYKRIQQNQLQPYQYQQAALHYYFPDGVFMLPEILRKAR